MAVPVAEADDGWLVGFVPFSQGLALMPVCEVGYHTGRQSELPRLNEARAGAAPVSTEWSLVGQGARSTPARPNRRGEWLVPESRVL